jgi:transcriptional regulator with XRE-family HTH domain
MTDSFGARLRQQRERQRIDVADVAARTKIKASLFEALERNDVSQWPAGLFRRSFIRAYAESIGLDPAATLREFLEHFPDPGDPPFDRPAPKAAARTERIAAVPAPPPAAAAVAASPVEMPSDLRLTLADAEMPFFGGRVLADAPQRWAAAAWDAGVLFAVGLVVFVVVNRFWMPFGIAALSYYVGGILLLGNSPGVCLFAPKSAKETRPTSEPVRALRPRHTEPGRGRPAEFPRNPFRPPRRGRTTHT